MKRVMLAIGLGMGLCSMTWAQTVLPPGVNTPAPTIVTPGDGVAVDGGTMAIDGTEPACDPGCLAPICCRHWPRVWGSAEYLLWQMKDSPLPVPLLFGGPGTPNGAPVVGTAMQTLAIGSQDVSLSARSGGRFTLGYWDDDDLWGTSVTYFFLGTASTGQVVGSTGKPGPNGLTIPFIDAQTGLESSTRVAFPGGFAGVAALDVTNDLQGLEWNGFARIGEDGRPLRFHLIGGFRYLNFVERLTYDTFSPSIVPPADVFSTQDAFDCRNYFYGAQIGGQAEYRRNRLLLRAQSKLAMGAMYEVVTMAGRLLTNDFNGFGAPQLFPAGYLVGPTNAGTRSTTRFAVIPEVNLNIGYQVTRRAAVLIGYSFLYVSNVVRPGDQIDRTINPSQFPSITGVPSTALVGPARPTPLMSTTDFWAQGLNIAVQFNY
jgi:hypothetical protein